MWTSFLFAAALVSAPPLDGFGHSKHGTAFDSGMRLKPWRMEGIGSAPLTITTKSAEAQEWFNQGNALLHSFWFEEAERSFRWCLKLDPDCAMAYLGLARSGMTWFNGGSKFGKDDRYRKFLDEAVKRKGSVSEREQMYIDAWVAGYGEDASSAKMAGKLKELTAKYPDEVDAKVLHGLFSIDEEDPAKNGEVISAALAKVPMHPGAHHAMIHNWDNHDGKKALDSCELYGQAAPAIGHSLHMPGHIYAEVGMWHEAALAMDSATRVELQYMNNRLALPFETWNYSHNRDFLCYIQEQLGMGDASIRGALDLMNSPRDPEKRNENEYRASTPLIRALVKFERWDQILDGKTLPGSPTEYGTNVLATARILAYCGKGRTQEAKTLMAEVRKKEKADKDEKLALYPMIAQSQVYLVGGLTESGLNLLKVAAEKDKKNRSGGFSDDPPSQPWPVARLLGDAYFNAKQYQEAVKAYDEALTFERNDAWTLAGLARTWAALGNTDKAKTYAGRFEAVWTRPDRGLKWTKSVADLNLRATPKAETLRPEREYNPDSLKKLGPSNWEPFEAPKLDCIDANGKRATLDQYKGKNVLLVFYLSESCVHCVEQLSKINSRMSEFEKQNTVVLGVSSTSPEANKESTKLAPFRVRLLSDQNHENARRFASYDDFEDIELHSTILIDTDGKVRWKRSGGEPFTNVDFLLKEIKRFSVR